MTRLLRDLELAFGDAAKFDTKTSFVAEQATYGEAYLQVGHQLGTALLASKEVLLVVADFPKVQVRNVAILRERLRRGAHRLQPGIGILAHRDPTGNAKLRQWGREAGLTVLPLDLSTGTPRHKSLLSALLEDLYTYDRFDLTGPVRSDFQFFGRPFVPDMARRLAEGTVTSLFGIRKIGKTSLLNRLARELTDGFGARVVFLDASHDAIAALQPAELLNVLANAAAEVDTGKYVSVSPAVSDGVVDTSTEADLLLEAITTVTSPLVLIIDEVDYLTPSSPTEEHWRTDFNVTLRALRRVYQEATRRSTPFSLLVSGVSSRWFTEESVDGIENAALALVPETYLAPLSRSESVEMIEKLGLACGLIFERGAADNVATTASDNPFWIRKAGSYINSCVPQDGRPARLDAGIVAALCEEFVLIEGAQLAYSSLRHLFRIYPELGLGAVDVVFGNSDRTPQEVLSTLGRYGILGEGFCASGPMVAAGLDRWKRADSASATTPRLFASPEASSVSAGSASSVGEELWAEMLGEVSTVRNAVERRLRDLILVVVRSELASDKARHPKDALVAAVPSERREALRGGATNILKAMYWLELLAVIRKNWKWFEKYFADRAKFDLYGEIVNDRPDAHAKDIDGADLALQKRALEWFDKAIDRSALL
ncbi:MAG TPA: AAA family ATPase [Ilumatobacter sp.]|nr:AAA family ATPase [Ilumatobacter sp.]